jgi:flavin-dependent dehydrogenase
VEVHIREGFEVYVTPVGGYLVNIAVLMGRERAGRLAGNLTGGYREMAAESGAVPDGSVLVDVPLAAGPFPAEARRTWQSNLVLVGDAAGFFDGVTGDGMSLALVSARFCAAALDRFLTSGEPVAFEEYTRKRRALVRNPQLLGRLLLALAAYPRIGTRVASNLERHPGTFTKLMRINQGECGFSSLRPRDLLAAVAGI